VCVCVCARAREHTDVTAGVSNHLQRTALRGLEVVEEKVRRGRDGRERHKHVSYALFGNVRDQRVVQQHPLRPHLGRSSAICGSGGAQVVRTCRGRRRGRCGVAGCGRRRGRCGVAGCSRRGLGGGGRGGCWSSDWQRCGSRAGHDGPHVADIVAAQRGCAFVHHHCAQAVQAITRGAVWSRPPCQPQRRGNMHGSLVLRDLSGWEWDDVRGEHHM
jgi:hypothetical protein